MSETQSEMQAGGPTEFVLHPHRSLSPRGFLILMALVSAVSFVAGMIFLAMGAWPVTGFFGLDVLLIYLAFKLNYRSGRMYERVSLTREQLQLMRVHPSGRREVFDFNPYWARVRVTTDQPDGRTSMYLAAQGKQVRFGQFLTDEERHEFANALTGALIASRTTRF